MQALSTHLPHLTGNKKTFVLYGILKASEVWVVESLRSHPGVNAFAIIVSLECKIPVQTFVTPLLFASC